MEEVKTKYVENKYFIREELNGITIYDRIFHNFVFYEGLTIADIDKYNNIKELEEYLDKNKDKKTQNIKSKYPFYIGWQLSGNCNLDCIYCFAEDTLHNPNSEDIMVTSKEILKLHPLSVGLSGGEPTLEPRLIDIMKLFKDKTTCVINTNGTTIQFEKLIPTIKETGTFVRLTIDSTDNEMLNTLRPPRQMPPGGYDQISMIRKNVKLMIDNDIPFLIHTVMTKPNMKTIEKTAHDLIEMGVKRWHLYKVDFSNKCKDFYDDIKVTTEEMQKNHDNLVSKFGDKINITSALVEAVKNRQRCILLIDSRGNFFIKNENYYPTFIGKDPQHPTYEEVMSNLNFENHIKCYVRNFWPR